VSVFTWPARVYWEDTDGGGVVYYANYLKYLERARTEWLRAHGFSQQELARDLGILFTVVNLNLEYKRAARLDDELIVTCEPRSEGAASLRFGQRILRDSKGAMHTDRRGAGLGAASLIVSAEVRIACVDARSFRPQRLPDALVSALSAQEPA